MAKIKKIVVAYSGGLDTSVIPQWLMETYGCEVIAFAADLGQEDDFAALRRKARGLGMRKVYVDDLKEEFVKDFIFPLLRANAVYEGSYLLGTAIARPLIAKRQIEIARAEKADAVCHGATGKGNDQVRFELTYLALNPKITIIAPWRLWHLNSRNSLIAYAREHNIPLQVTPEKPYSMDRNLFHLSFEGGILEDPWQEPDEGMFQLTVAPEAAPDQPQYLEIDFSAGDPVAIDDEALSPADLLARLNEIGGAHGIGRLDLVENRFVGMKSRGVYETPGGTVLHAAHRAMESITMDREVMHRRDRISLEIARAFREGRGASTPEMLSDQLDLPVRTVRDLVRALRVGRLLEQTGDASGAHNQLESAEAQLQYVQTFFNRLMEQQVLAA